MHIPSEIEYASGIIKKHINAGTASVRSLKSIFEIEDLIIMNPTTTSAGVVAKDGIARKIGERKSATKKSNAVTIDVNPVLPPDATPEALST